MLCVNSFNLLLELIFSKGKSFLITPDESTPTWLANFKRPIELYFFDLPCIFGLSRSLSRRAPPVVHVPRLLDVDGDWRLEPPIAAGEWRLEPPALAGDEPLLEDGDEDIPASLLVGDAWLAMLCCCCLLATSVAVVFIGKAKSDCWVPMGSISSLQTNNVTHFKQHNKTTVQIHFKQHHGQSRKNGQKLFLIVHHC